MTVSWEGCSIRLELSCCSGPVHCMHCKNEMANITTNVVISVAKCSDLHCICAVNVTLNTCHRYHYFIFTVCI